VPPEWRTERLRFVEVSATIGAFIAPAPSALRVEGHPDWQVRSWACRDHDRTEEL
jgi:hypothetical protein